MTDQGLINVVIILFVGITLAIFMVLPSRRSKYEYGLTALYEERCQGRSTSILGLSFSGSAISWRITLYDDFMVIKSIGSTRIDYAEIKSVSLQKDELSKLVVICLSGSSSKVFLSSKSPNRLIELISERSRT